MIGLILLAASLPFMPMTAAPYHPEEEARLCEPWFANRHDSDVRGETFAPAANVRCFDGKIDSESGKAFVMSVSRLTAADQPVIVVRSVGGDVESGMDMADEIRRIRAGVVVRNICFSSCANYLIGAARIRIVPEDALLGFHGGAEAMTTAELLRQARSEHTPYSMAQARAASRRTRSDAARQARFVASAGIASRFLQQNIVFNRLPSETKKHICGQALAGTAFMVFSPAFLKSQGIAFQRYDGPASAEQLRATLTHYGMPENYACYIDQPLPQDELGSTLEGHE